MDKVNIREMVSSDLNDVVRVHQRAFKGFFLDKMGISFLKSYYTCVLNHGSSIAIISLDSKNCLNGFAVATRVVDLLVPTGFPKFPAKNQASGYPWVLKYDTKLLAFDVSLLGTTSTRLMLRPPAVVKSRRMTEAAGRGADFDNSVCISILNFSARSRDVKLPKATTPESLSDWISPAAIGN